MTDTGKTGFARPGSWYKVVEKTGSQSKIFQSRLDGWQNDKLKTHARDFTAIVERTDETTLQPGDQILNSFQCRTQKTGSRDFAGNAGHILRSCAREIAAKILVNDPGSHGQREIRIFLKESVLQGTEVRILFENGHLFVKLLPGSNKSRSLLSQQRPDLKKQLKSNLQQDVRVEVL